MKKFLITNNSKKGVIIVNNPLPNSLRNALWRFIGNRWKHPYSYLPILLINGLGRSGTTVLRRAIGVHPEVHSTERENNILRDLFDVGLRNETWEDRRSNMLVSESMYRSIFHNQMLHLLWPQPCIKYPPKCIVCAATVSSELSEYFLKICSKGKILYLIRNGIEVVSSRMRYGVFAEQPFEFHCDAWASMAHDALWYMQNKKAFVCRHEELCQSPGDVFDNIYHWLELKPCSSSAGVLTNDVIHPTGPVDEREDKSKRYLSWTTEQRNYFNEHCGSIMQRLGYSFPW